MQILDIRPSKNDVVIDFVASRNLGSFLFASFCPKRPNVLQRYVGIFGVYSIQNPLIPNLTLGCEAYEAANVRVSRVRPSPSPHFASTRNSNPPSFPDTVVTLTYTSSHARHIVNATTKPGRLILSMAVCMRLCEEGAVKHDQLEIG